MKFNIKYSIEYEIESDNREDAVSKAEIMFSEGLRDLQVSDFDCKITHR